jgi:hypothetical protein
MIITLPKIRLTRRAHLILSRRLPEDFELPVPEGVGLDVAEFRTRHRQDLTAGVTAFQPTSLPRIVGE